jgi:hypothetical protein
MGTKIGETLKIITLSAMEHPVITDAIITMTIDSEQVGS